VFYGLCGLGAAFIGVGAYRQRVRRTEARARELTLVVNERTQELRQEIAERHRAEEVLRESEERYRLLFEASPNPMWVFDIETLAFLAVNRAAVGHYAYAPEEFLAMTI